MLSPLPPALPTPIKLNSLKQFLTGYDHCQAKLLIDGFSFGFRIHSIADEAFSSVKNLLSARLKPGVVDVKLAKELEAGRIAGPFTLPPFARFRISPLGVVPKKSPGEYRMIHHLSYPKGNSVNDGIDESFTSVSYATIDDAITCIKRSGIGSFMAKTDVKNAFRIIPIHPGDYHLLGIQWRGLYYFDKCMPMGCSSSCKTFEALSTALEWMARYKLKISFIIHLLDDFFLCEPSKAKCQSSLSSFLELCDSLGVPIAPEKTVGPAQVLSFAGIELDSLSSEARLPHNKLQESLDLLGTFLRKKKASLVDLQRLIGKLNFACSVVVPGRAFLRRLIDLTIGLKHPKHYVRLTREVKADICVWQHFLQQFNGRSFFLEDAWLDNQTLQLFTDSSGVLGFGAIFGSNWCYGEWPKEWQSLNIATLEFYPIVLSLYLWGSAMCNKCIIFFTDNEALVSVINRCTCKDKTLMVFVRKMVAICLKHNILFKARHIPGVRNILADALSRLQIRKFLELAPTHFNPLPTQVPVELLPQNWVL